MKILITGAAGFIGYHTANKLLLNKKNKVVGLDSMNNYYDKRLKYQRIKKLKEKYKKNFRFEKLNLCQKKKIFNLFKLHKFDKVINLAAQAGVRYSIRNPEAYFKNNLLAFFNMLEACRNFWPIFRPGPSKIRFSSGRVFLIGSSGRVGSGLTFLDPTFL